MTGDVDPGKENCSLNAERAITHVNQAVLSDISVVRMESFSFRGAKNEEVEGFIVDPPDFDPARNTL